MAKDEFIAIVAADQPDAPPYFTYDAILNTQERATLSVSLRQGLQPLTLDAVLAPDLQLLDVRDASEYATGHLPGSINIGLSGSYATCAGTVLDRSRPIVLIAEPGREEEAALRLGRIGFDNVRGYLEGGMAAAASRPDLLRTIDRISVQTAAEELAAPAPPLLLDVRTPAEWSASHIAGSLNIPLNHLQSRLAELPFERPIAVLCGGGYRSSIAAGILRNHGITQLFEVAGGMAAWDASHLLTTSAA
jgi:rhodanese-related sulfurtransferase